ncbi:hypothetical protein [Nocardioides sp. zg-1228]|uniref:hypothetical protein n=1 Tax=Nocardioides sp. zg-1228 TaxID=2763008 RepID=UPI001642F5C2|nr:hypothetical protein [Nocardioides sp. zg-1228]MBC2932333.1 hypothetical protein [Nocardioides sp. zg-1228]QSF57849.1 hypothetical protein JX575_01010 [Nocardioides sp. zg-1228]
MIAVLWLLTIVLVLLTVIDPRRLWYATTAWQFRHPEANEPSAAVFALGRVVSGVAAVVVGLAALVSTAGAAAPLSQDRLDAAGRNAASELAGPYFKYSTPGVERVAKALGRGDVTVTEAGTVTEDSAFGAPTPTTDRFELVSAEDASIAGCLEVSYEGGLFQDADVDVDVEYSSGAC